MFSCVRSRLLGTVERAWSQQPARCWLATAASTSGSTGSTGASGTVAVPSAGRRAAAAASRGPVPKSDDDLVVWKGKSKWSRKRYDVYYKVPKHSKDYEIVKKAWGDQLDDQPLRRRDFDSYSIMANVRATLLLPPESRGLGLVSWLWWWWRRWCWCWCCSRMRGVTRLIPGAPVVMGSRFLR